MNNQEEFKDKNTILFSISEKIATITINRPNKMKALRMQEFEGLINCITQADDDPSVNVIRIRSAGERAFSGGLDINMVQIITPEEIFNLLNCGYGLVKTIIHAKKPIVVQIQGAAVAWGAIICLAADFVIAGKNPKAFLSLPEIGVGLFPATGALITTLFNTGYRKAKQILMIPTRIPLDEALNIGLVTKIVPFDSLDQSTFQFCQNLTDKNQALLIPIKMLINNFHYSNLDVYIEKEKEAFKLAMNGDLEALTSFRELLWKS